MKVVFEQNGTFIYSHKKHKILHLKWQGPDCSKLYTDVLKALKHFTVSSKIEGWLIDLSNCQTVQSNAMKDIEHVASGLTEGNLKRYARVVSRDSEYEKEIIGKIAQLNKAFNLGITIANFKTESEALAWLFEATEGTLEEEKV